MTDHYETRCPLCGGSDEQGCYRGCPNTTAEAREEAAFMQGRAQGMREAAEIAERDVDWPKFGKKDIAAWENGIDDVRDYRLGICAGRAIAVALRTRADAIERGE